VLVWFQPDPGVCHVIERGSRFAFLIWISHGGAAPRRTTGHGPSGLTELDQVPATVQVPRYDAGPAGRHWPG
jgi:hypothetical protein